MNADSLPSDKFNSYWIDFAGKIIAAIIGATAPMLTVLISLSSNTGLSSHIEKIVLIIGTILLSAAGAIIGLWVVSIFFNKQSDSGALIGIILPSFPNYEKRELASGFLKEQIRKFIKVNRARPFWLDFHGNVAILFISKNNPRWKNIENLAYQLFLFGIDLHTSKTGDVRCGIILDWEQNAVSNKICSKKYLLCDTSSNIQALLPYTLDGHFLVSRDIHSKLMNHPKFGETWKFDLFSLHDIQKRQHEFYNSYGSAGLFGNADLPGERVTIEYRDDQKFIDIIAEASRLVIIGLTHEKLHLKLSAALNKRNNLFWDQLIIVFPQQDRLKYVLEDKRNNGERLGKWEIGRFALSQFLLGAANYEKWECLDYPFDISYTGTRIEYPIRDSMRKPSSIRISPLQPGADQKETPILEIFEGNQAYTKISKSFDAIISNSNRITEYDLYGISRGKDVEFGGLIDHKSIYNLQNRCFPIVLIMLYEDIGGARKLLLQERNAFNARSDHGKLSNISGRITDLDAFAALKRTLSNEYLQIRYGIIDNTKLSRLFSKETGIQQSTALGDAIWLNAAVREIKEETGLEIPEGRLKQHKDLLVIRPPNSQHDLGFRLFSLHLDGNDGCLDKQEIVRLRPNVNLKEYSLAELDALHRDQKFNHLLNANYDQVFRPILSNELHIQ